MVNAVFEDVPECVQFFGFWVLDFTISRLDTALYMLITDVLAAYSLSLFEVFRIYTLRIRSVIQQNYFFHNFKALFFYCCDLLGMYCTYVGI